MDNEKTQAAHRNTVEQLVGLLREVKEYIEGTEERIDGEWGTCRSAQTLIEARDMPDVYWKVVTAIEANAELRREGNAPQEDQ